jgi:hypothetical protein
MIILGEVRKVVWWRYLGGYPLMAGKQSLTKSGHQRLRFGNIYFIKYILKIKLNKTWGFVITYR